VNAKAGFEGEVWSARFSGSIEYKEMENATTLDQKAVLDSVAKCVEYNAKIAEIIQVNKLTFWHQLYQYQYIH